MNNFNSFICFPPFLFFSDEKIDDRVSTLPVFMKAKTDEQPQHSIDRQPPAVEERSALYQQG
jgi:hypothetical protein